MRVGTTPPARRVEGDFSASFQKSRFFISEASPIARCYFIFLLENEIIFSKGISGFWFKDRSTIFIESFCSLNCLTTSTSGQTQHKRYYSECCHLKMCILWNRKKLYFAKWQKPQHATSEMILPCNFTWLLSITCITGSLHPGWVPRLKDFLGK